MLHGSQAWLSASGYKNEAGIGRTITGAKSTLGLDRRDIFVTTKLWPGNPQRGMETKDYAGTVAAFDSSLQRLELDYVDLLSDPCTVCDR